MLALFAAAALLGPTRFTVQNQSGAWFLADPSGKPFLSFGVCCVDSGTAYPYYDHNNPSYAGWKHYRDASHWAQDTVARLQSWGFNTIGAWSDFDDIRKIRTHNFYFTPILHMGSTAGAPWKDMWDPGVVKTMDKVARAQMVRFTGDSRVVGYFSDNEMGWWEGALFDWAWKTPGGRSHLLKVLQARYPSWSALCRDFEPVEARDFSGLGRTGRLYLRAGGKGMAAVQKYVGVLADRYYSLCRSIIKRYDPAALYLGDRYISNFYPEVATASAPYVDVCSTNLNADWNDGSCAQFYLPALEACVKKPILIGEYYMASTENRSGNRNNSSGFPVAPTQAARSDGFVKQTQFFLGFPFVVGAHWFQYYDEPKNGRGDGENYDMGLVDVDNRPYLELTTAAAVLDLKGIHNRALPARQVIGVPRVHGDPSKLEDWRKDLGYVPSDNGFSRGDLYLSWTPENFYVALYWNEDRFNEALYRDGKVPPEDQPTITVQLDGKSYVARADASFHPDGFTQVLSGGAGVRRFAILGIPAIQAGSVSYTEGLRVDLKVTLTTRGRAYTGKWSGSFPLHFNE